MLIYSQLYTPWYFNTLSNWSWFQSQLSIFLILIVEMLLLLLSDEASPPLYCIELVLFLEPPEESSLLDSRELLDWLRERDLPFYSAARLSCSFCSLRSTLALALAFLISWLISCITRAYLCLVLLITCLPKLSKLGTAFWIISIVYSSSLETSLESLLVELL